MHDAFISFANNLRNENLLKTEDFFVRQRDIWFNAFAANFRCVCAEVLRLQESGALTAVSYLEYTMLYTNFVAGRYVAEVMVYGDRSYLDENRLMVGTYDISFLFEHFDKMWNELLSARKRFVGMVTAQEITAFMLEALPDFFSYLTNIARFAIVECVKEKPYIDIAKNVVFMVNVGDYMAKTEPIYVESKEKDENELKDWFSEGIQDAYIFGDYSKLNFSGHIFSNTDFRYARFEETCLNDTSFEGSALIGVNFRGAHMENCRLNNCHINEADFSNACLRNASLINVNARTGLTDPSTWKFAGFLPVSFRGADLTGADFSGADLTGADFSGALLKDVDFTDAILNDAVFE